MFLQNNQLFYAGGSYLINLNTKINLLNALYSTAAPSNPSSLAPLILPSPFSMFPVYLSFNFDDLAQFKEQLSNKPGIYCVIMIDSLDGKARFYIGSSNDLFRRLGEHHNPVIWKRENSKFSKR